MTVFFRYLIAGGINTLVGYGVFLFLFWAYAIQPAYANAVGYLVALILAFILNKFFVFKSPKLSLGVVTRFYIAFLCAFLLNQLVLFLLCSVLLLSAEISQIFAMAGYTLLFYYLNKIYVFKN